MLACTRTARIERLAWALLVASIACAGCAEGPQEKFERLALPVLESRCLTAACHGVEHDAAWPSAEGFFVRLGKNGFVTDVASARSTARSRIVTQVAPELSSLLWRPMPKWADGGPHLGGALFLGPEDPAVLDLIEWIESEESGGEDRQLDALQQQFADTVMPVLAQRCARAGCHGPTSLAFSAFSAHVSPTTQEFAPSEVVSAYESARKHLDLWSDDPRRSRLVQKALGEHEGGIVHRGGIGTLFPDTLTGSSFDAPGIQAMVAWARAERTELLGDDTGDMTGLVYVRGVPSARTPYRIEPGPVGDDLFFAAWPIGERAPVNLTEDLREGRPAELRDPAVSHDATRVVFAMRFDDEARFSLWELELQARTATRLRPDGAAGSFVAPRYAPDGTIIAVWDGHGEAGTDGPGIAPELVALDREGGFTRLTYTPVPEVSPSFIPAGKAAGDLVFGTRRSGSDGSSEAVLFRFPLCHDPKHHGEPEYHVHFGSTVAPRAPLLARDLPDGRQLLIVLESSAASDDHGQLALLDRALGAALPEDLEVEAGTAQSVSSTRAAAASVGGYREPFTLLDAAVRFRDPAPLPDGSFVVSVGSEQQPLEDRIVQARLGSVQGAPQLELGATLLEERGYALRGAAPVFVRPLEDPPHAPIVDTRIATGKLLLRDVRILEALYGRTAPIGARTLREDLRAVRVLAWRGTRADDFVRDEHGGSNVGLTAALPVRVLGEVPLQDDGSVAIEVPARTPLRLQWLDARGMVVGNQLDRFYYAEGAEIVPGGTNPTTYGHICAGCHGSLSGLPSDAQTAPPDAISAASLTLATHEARNPRAPKAALAMLEPALDVDFVHDVAPRLQGTCAGSGCHSGEDAAAGIALDDAAFEPGARFSPAYEALIGAIDRSDLRARRSTLVERLSGEELEAPSALSGRCPPDGADAELLRTVARWIETGAFYDLSVIEAGDER